MSPLNYKKINNIVGWLVFAVALFTYTSTMEKAGSFWDCGEFASCAFKLQNPHPPGAPFFILCGRLFVVLFGGFLGAIGAINFLTAVCSAFTILFLFWTITFFAKRLIGSSEGKTNTADLVAIMGAGVVGALAFAFSDSFWFSAVEAEVYGMSSFFTALSFWIIVRWNRAVDEGDPFADKWIVFIALTIGLSIGVHLLNILTIPAVVMFYYFKKYTVTTKGALIAFLIACAITGISQKFLIQYITSFAASFDLFFVNILGLPFFSGTAVFIVVLSAVYYFLFKKAAQKGWYIVKLSAWCSIFIIIGLFSYAVTLIRSNADTPIDMYNVDNMKTLVGYLGRAQYGDFPLVYGPVFTAKPTDREEVGTIYDKFNGKYEPIGKETKEIFASSDKMLFPRVWDYTDQQDHISHYKMWLGLEDGEKPTFADNLRWFFSYQLNWMYFRYFMWNFAGRQNDIQNVNGNPRDGNWLSGIPFVDNVRLGDQTYVPEQLKNSPSRNTLFMLPLLLGILGFYFQYKNKKRDCVVAGLLFVFTGLAVCVYLNAAGNQPRERDYVFVGSFYAFAIWIGLGLVWLRSVLSKKLNVTTASVLSFIICFVSVPALMAREEWDDHDRGKKTLVKDVAINYLESCPQNAVLFCYGDNDTYPLWYAQQVEGVRPDVRVINTALLGAEWYVNQLRYKVDSSDRVPLPFSREKTIGSSNDVVFININQAANNGFYNLDTILNLAIEQKKFQVQSQSGSSISSIPVSRFILPANEAEVRKKSADIYPSDVIDPMPRLILPEKAVKGGYIFRNDLAVLATIASFKWERPVCFTSPSFITSYGLQQYARTNGLVYELAPLANNTGININWILDRIEKNKFSFTSFKNKDTYYNEEDRRNIDMMRQNYLDLIGALVQFGRKQEAEHIFKRMMKELPDENSSAIAMRDGRYPNSIYIGVSIARMAKELGDSTAFKKLYVDMERLLLQEKSYYESLSETRAASFRYDISSVEQMLAQLQQLK